MKLWYLPGTTGSVGATTVETFTISTTKAVDIRLRYSRAGVRYRFTNNTGYPVVVEGVIGRVIFVTVSRPGAITLSTRLKELAGFEIFHLAFEEPSKVVQLKFTPPTVCSLTLVGVGLM